MWKQISVKKFLRSLIVHSSSSIGVGEVAYCLALPARLKVHNVFHVSFVKCFHTDLEPERQVELHAPANVQEQFDQTIELILDCRMKGIHAWN